MITIKEIANQLGVSPTTVSNVVNGRTEKMSAKTRQRIEEALIKNHYVNDTKHQEYRAELKMIAVDFFLKERENVIQDPFCGELLGAIEKFLKPYGRYVLYNSSESEEELLKKFSARNVEGGILLGYPPTKCEFLQDQVLKPLIFIDCGDGDYDNIGLQDMEGGFEAASYLIRQGHRRIAYFTDTKTQFGSSYERLQGIKKAMEQKGCLFHQEDVYLLPEEKNMRHELLRQFTKKIKEYGYTAVFFTSDFFANEGINIFCSQGLEVPEDLSVVGFDDNIYARLSRPLLTTVRQSPTEKAKEAVHLLMKRIYGEEVLVRNLRLPTELIVRESVKNISNNIGNFSRP